MLFKRLCDVPRLVMHQYILVQTSLGNFIVISSVKTQFIEEHKNLGICRSYEWFINYTCHLPVLSLTRYHTSKFRTTSSITLEKIITTNVKNHCVYWSFDGCYTPTREENNMSLVQVQVGK